MSEVKKPQKYKICDKCECQVMEVTKYKDKQYCTKCNKKAIEYESDAFRKKHDIRFRDPKTLTWYQQAQLNVIKGHNQYG